jgi:nucleoid-associated protein YgaU
MDCHAARRLLAQGVVPGSTDAQRATLGFHLSGCPACRAYRKNHDELLLLGGLLTQPLAPCPARVPVRRRASRRPLRLAGAALMVGGALAVVPLTGLLPATAAAAGPAPVAGAAPRAPAQVARRVVSRAEARPDADLLVAHQRTAVRAPAQRADDDLLESLLERSARVARGSQLAQIALTPGQELTIPALPAAPAAGPAAAPAEQVPAIYVVRAGDTLWDIAGKLYGDSTLWPAIYEVNKTIIGGNPNLIYPNQRLTIPANPPRIQPPVTTPPAPQTGPGIGLYTIVRGDTLSDIAFRTYGNAGRWPEIYARNQRVIGADANLIFPGTVLDMPAR